MQVKQSKYTGNWLAIEIVQGKKVIGCNKDREVAIHRLIMKLRFRK